MINLGKAINGPGMFYTVEDIPAEFRIRIRRAWPMARPSLSPIFREGRRGGCRYAARQEM